MLTYSKNPTNRSFSTNTCGQQVRNDIHIIFTNFSFATQTSARRASLLTIYHPIFSQRLISIRLKQYVNADNRFRYRRWDFSFFSDLSGLAIDMIDGDFFAIDWNLVYKWHFSCDECKCGPQYSPPLAESCLIRSNIKTEILNMLIVAFCDVNWI